MIANKSNILLVYTGGTIGMEKDTETGALHAFNFDNLLKQIPELKLIECNIQTLSLPQPIDSSNMNPKYWVKIAEIIETNYHHFDGFVILHGSDTMSYTASTLSFMLENLAKPVILTGAQLPIGDLRTDARENLMTSIQLASLTNNDATPVIQEVCLYFEYKLYRGNRTSKINAENFQAFNSLNYPCLAESGVHLKINYQYILKANPNTTLRVHTNLNDNIILIKLFPGITASFIKSAIDIPHVKALILETYGSGNCTTETWFIDALKMVISKGKYIISVTQCVGGGVTMGKYESSKALMALGVISAKDMTTESAIAKTMFLLGQYLPPEMFKTSFEKSLRGEIA
ncbi:asparaginase [Flavobacteriaceae bacterium MHTCC 0001]